MTFPAIVNGEVLTPSAYQDFRNNSSSVFLPAGAFPGARIVANGAQPARIDLPHFHRGIL
jgi:hypothetical protein